MIATKFDWDLADGVEYMSNGHDAFHVVEGEPTSAEAVSLRTFTIRRPSPGTTCSVTAWGRMTATTEEFLLEHTLDVTEAGRCLPRR